MAQPDKLLDGVPPFVSVVGDSFFFPNALDLIVKREAKGFFYANFDVLDLNGNLLFQIDGKILQFQRKRVLRDSAGIPILTMHEKLYSWPPRWTIHHGDSSDTRDLLFTVRCSHWLQMKADLDVFLAGNVREDICNYHVSGSYTDQSFRVYKGDTLIAEVEDDSKFWSFLLKGEASFRMKVYPGVDYAFIVSLLVILNENEML